LAFDTLFDQGVSLVVVDHCFGIDPNELHGLVNLIRACHEHQVFLVTGASPSLAGLEESFLKNPTGMKHDAEAWQEDWTDEAREAWGQLASLREQGAQFALALPRCLVRHPYGKLGQPLENFDFEELESGAGLEQFLWVNGAYLVARALMEQWCGGAPLTDASFEIGGLPVVSVMDVEGRRVQPPLELSFPRAVVDQLLDQGFSFIEAWRDTDRARVHV
jgi:type VI secretion system protein ImpC